MTPSRDRNVVAVSVPMAGLPPSCDRSPARYPRPRSAIRVSRETPAALLPGAVRAAGGGAADGAAPGRPGGQSGAGPSSGPRAESPSARPCRGALGRPCPVPAAFRRGGPAGLSTARQSDLPHPGDGTHDRRMDTIRAASAFAAAQYGVISRGQALRHGVVGPLLRSLVRQGAWLPLHRDVYLVGEHTPATERGRLLTA